MNKSGYPRWTSVSTKITLSWSQISKSDEPLCVCRIPSKIHTSWRSAAACSGLYERGNQSCLPRRENLVSRNSFWKSVLWDGSLFLKGGELDGAPGPTAGCAYPTLNVWPRWGKDGCRIFSGWFLPGINICPKCYPTQRKKLVTCEKP